MREALSLQIKNDIGEIGKMSDEVATWCQRMGLSEELGYQLELVLDEHVSNVIRHGLKDNGEHIVRVGVRCDEHELIVEVEDDGVPFNPLESATPDITKPIEERRIGGLGIHLVRQIMDRLAYERRDGKNYMYMKKSLVEE